MLIYDKIILPKGKLWKRFGPLHIDAPPKEYILALKIMAVTIQKGEPLAKRATHRIQ
jgi:hypothetical protein